MSIFVVLLILLSALFHVAWNLIGKSSAPSAAFFLGTSLFAVIALSPVYCIVPLWTLPSKAWLFFIAAGFFQSIYYVGLSGGYKNGDMSSVYPLARALPVLFIPVITTLLHSGTPLSLSAVLGMVLVSFGCILLPVNKKAGFHFGNYITRATFFSILAAFGTTGYTLVDSAGVQYLSGIVHGQGLQHMYIPPIVYLAYEMLMASVVSSLYIIVQPQERKNFVRILVGSKRSTSLAGLFILAAYGIILLSYPLVTNVSFITAFRQISIPLGALGGIFILKEGMSTGKIAGSLVIFLGLVLVYL